MNLLRTTKEVTDKRMEDMYTIMHIVSHSLDDESIHNARAVLSIRNRQKFKSVLEALNRFLSPDVERAYSSISL